MYNGKHIMVFGTGSNAEMILDKDLIHIDLFIDNDKTKVGSLFRGKRVISSDMLTQYNRDSIYIYIASMYYSEIKSQLEELGFAENEHFCAVDFLFRIDNELVDYGNLYIPNKVKLYEQTYIPELGVYSFANNPSKFNYANVEVEVGRFYYSFINLVGATYILETGTNSGYSTAMISAALKRKNQDGLVYTIDPLDIRKVFDFDEIGNIRFIQGISLTADLPDGIVFDIIVLDSDHTYFTVMNELIRFEPLLKTGGYILMHDTLYYDGVGLAAEQIYNNPRFEVITLETPRYHEHNGRVPGISVIRKNFEDDRYPLKFSEQYKDTHVFLSKDHSKCRSESYINKMRAISRDKL